MSFDKKINKIWKEFLASDDRKAIDVERENDFKKKLILSKLTCKTSKILESKSKNSLKFLNINQFKLKFISFGKFINDS